MGVWQIKLGEQWEKYDATVGKALVEAKSKGAKEYRFELKGQPMVVDFRTMTQTNVKTGKSRPVREAPRAAPVVKPSEPSAGPAKYPKLSKPSAGDDVYAAADELAAFTHKAAMHDVESAESPDPMPKGVGKVAALAAQGDIYVHTTPSAPPPVAPAAPVPAAPTTPEKTDAKKPEAKRKGAGFFTGMAVGTVAAAGAGVGIGLATGAITTDDIGDAAAEVGDAMAGVAADVGEAIEDAAMDVADFVTG